MRIGREPYTDPKTKTPGTRYLMRFDRVDEVEGELVTSSAYEVFVINEKTPADAVTALKATFRAAVASTSPDLIAQLLNSES
jgi:hypothetical protein